MDTVSTIVIVWVLVSIPTAIIAARYLRGRSR